MSSEMVNFHGLVDAITRTHSALAVQAAKAVNISNAGRRQLYGYLNFYRCYPQIVRTASAQSAQLLLPQLVGRVSAA